MTPFPDIGWLGVGYELDSSGPVVKDCCDSRTALVDREDAPVTGGLGKAVSDVLGCSVSGRAKAAPGATWS